VTDVDPLQKALAGEHAAVWGYGVVGAHLRGSELATARAALAAHLARRDRVAARVRDLGGVPVAAEGAYTVPRPVRTASDAAVLATELEENVAAVWADVVAATTGPDRSAAVAALSDAAVRAALWRGGSVPFPGLPERAAGG